MQICQSSSGLDSELFLKECKKSRGFDLNKVKEYIQNGANINSCEKGSKMNALHYAALNGNKTLVFCLLEHNINLLSQDQFGLTALDWAKRGKLFPLVECRPLLVLDNMNQHDECIQTITIEMEDPKGTVFHQEFKNFIS